MFEQFVYAVVMMLISYAIQVSNQPKPPNVEAGKLDVPEPKPGEPFPVLFGTNIVKSMNIIWYGDAKTTPIKKKAGGK